VTVHRVEDGAKLSLAPKRRLRYSLSKPDHDWSIDWFDFHRAGREMVCPMPEADNIRRFIEERFLIEYDESFPEDTDLFREGIMDSFGYVQLHRFLEREFHITFSAEEMTGNVLVSLTRIRARVKEKLGAQPTGASAGP
jgi:acyl carrier protein